MKKRALILAILVLITLVIPACSSGKEDADTGKQNIEIVDGIAVFKTSLQNSFPKPSEGETEFSWAKVDEQLEGQEFYGFQFSATYNTPVVVDYLSKYSDRITEMRFEDIDESYYDALYLYPKLVSLEIQRNRFDLSDIDNMPGIQRLTLNSNDSSFITKSYRNLGLDKFPNLRELNIFSFNFYTYLNVSEATKYIMECIDNMPYLEKINGAPVSESELIVSINEYYAGKEQDAEWTKIFSQAQKFSRDTWFSSDVNTEDEPYVRGKILVAFVGLDGNFCLDCQEKTKTFNGSQRIHTSTFEILPDDIFADGADNCETLIVVTVESILSDSTWTDGTPRFIDTYYANIIHTSDNTRFSPVKIKSVAPPEFIQIPEGRKPPQHADFPEILIYDFIRALTQ